MNDERVQFRTGVMAKLHSADNQAENQHRYTGAGKGSKHNTKMTATTRAKSTKRRSPVAAAAAAATAVDSRNSALLSSGGVGPPLRFRRGAAAPGQLSATHPLERARLDVERAINTFQALVHLENADHHHHKTTPIPKIMSGEAQAYAALANVLRLQYLLCLSRSNSRIKVQYKSARSESPTELFEQAVQYCDVALGIAGSIGNHHIEAFALKSLSDLARTRHVHDVASHRLNRAISFLQLMPETERKRGDGKSEQLLARMLDDKYALEHAAVTRQQHLDRIRERLGSSAAVEEQTVREAYVAVAMRRGIIDGGGPITGENALKAQLNQDGLFEWSQRMGCYPELGTFELDEAMSQIAVVGANVDDPNKAAHDLVDFDHLLVWWLESL